MSTGTTWAPTRLDWCDKCIKGRPHHTGDQFEDPSVGVIHEQSIGSSMIADPLRYEWQVSVTAFEDATGISELQVYLPSRPEVIEDPDSALRLAQTLTRAALLLEGLRIEHGFRRSTL